MSPTRLFFLSAYEKRKKGEDRLLVSGGASADLGGLSDRRGAVLSGVGAYRQCLAQARVEPSVQCDQELAAFWANCRARREQDPTVRCMQELTAILTQPGQPGP